jgi:hypothetical protein
VAVSDYGQRHLPFLPKALGHLVGEAEGLHRLFLPVTF